MRIDQAAAGLSKQMCFKQGTPPNPKLDLSPSSLKVISYLTHARQELHLQANSPALISYLALSE